MDTRKKYINLYNNYCIAYSYGQSTFQQLKKQLAMLNRRYTKYLWVFICVLLCNTVLASEKININKLADAIYTAENSKKYPYGIKSIDTHGDKTYARKICINTIKNNIKRYEDSDKSIDYITFLGNRYCPPTAHSLNKHWVRNVKYFYYKNTDK